MWHSRLEPRSSSEVPQGSGSCSPACFPPTTETWSPGFKACFQVLFWHGRRKITTPRRLEGRGSSEVPRLPDVGGGMLLAGYARDCQQRAVVLTWRCINPHPGILPNCPPPTQHRPPPTMVCHGGERGKNVRLDDTYVATLPTKEVLF